jgi:hypothetical protein
LNDGVRRSYADAVKLRRARLSDAFYRVPMDSVFLRSDRHVVEPLLDLFASRRQA